jgi:hypothetical protein
LFDELRILSPCPIVSASGTFLPSSPRGGFRMAQHGYLREYDEGWDRDDDRNRDRERGSHDRDRDWRGSGGEWSHRERGWHDDDRASEQRSRNFMFGDRASSRDWDRGSGRRENENYPQSMGDRSRSWFGDDHDQYQGGRRQGWQGSDRGSWAGYGREQGYGDYQRGYGSQQQGGFEGRGDWERSPRNFSSHQDDHYRSWRDRQMSALDRDYADYCREREQQFHSDFDNWRQNRQNRASATEQQPQGAGQQQSKRGSKTSEEVMELTTPTNLGPDPTAEATLGTNNSENSGVGRGRA